MSQTKTFKQLNIFLKKCIAGFLCLVMCLTSGGPLAFAATDVQLPTPGALVLTTRDYNLPQLAGLTVDPHNPLKFDFLINAGDLNPDADELSKQATALIKYFLVALTTPAENLWVNLSPNERDRIVADGLSRTAMGRDLLAQDYLLKQLTASLLSPEEETGAEYWQRLFKNVDPAVASQISSETINKIWIVPESASVYVNDGHAVITDSRLKVMLEADYLAMETHAGETKSSAAVNEVNLQLIRDIVLPVIEDEVNNGETFANLRQVYSAIILSAWFKRNLRANILNQVYADQSRTDGVESNDPAVNEHIYDQYMKALKKGVYNQVREDFDEITKTTVPRHYFSGGVDVRQMDDVLSVEQSQLGRQDLEDLAMLVDAVDRPESLYVVKAGLEDTQGQLSYRQTQVRRADLWQAEVDRAILSSLDGIVRHPNLALDSQEAFRQLLNGVDNATDRAKLIDDLVAYVMTHTHLKATAGSFSTPSILSKEVRRVVTDWVNQESQVEATETVDRRVTMPPVRQISGLMVAMSLMDVGAVINDKGAIDYEDSLAKAQALLPALARDGVRQLYLYGGLFDMAETSKQLHQVPDDGAHYLKSADGRVITRIEGYRTKRARVSGAGTDELLYDQHGNNFSIYRMDRFNPKLTSASTEGSDDSRTRAELQDLIANAKALGISVVTDFVPWMAPDGVNDENVSWTRTIRPADQWDEARQQRYRSVASSQRDKINRQLLDDNPGYFIYIADDGLPVLVNHFNNGHNIDQTYLNAFLPQVQDYYISALKNLIDLGVEGVRVDLAHYLLASQLTYVFGSPATKADEPWLRIMREVSDYAKQRQAEFTFILETYSPQDKTRLQSIGREAGAQVQVYHKELEDAYHAVVLKNESAHRLAHVLNTAVEFIKDKNEPRRMAPATFDDQSLGNIGGPVRGLMEMLLVLSEFGVPTKFDLREWIQHRGHVISMVGGIAPDGTITHPYVTDEEFEARMTDGGLTRIVDEQPWNQFINALQPLVPEGASLIRQKHADYPWYTLDYAVRQQRNDYITVGWANGSDQLNLYVLNTRSRAGTADILLPKNFAERWQQRTVRVDFAEGQQGRLISLSRSASDRDVQLTDVLNGQLKKSDLAMSSDADRISRLLNDVELLRDELAKYRQEEPSLLSRLPGGIAASIQSLFFAPADVEKFINQGVSVDAHRKLGAHPIKTPKGSVGTYFAVWAPNAAGVQVVGDFNEWEGAEDALKFNPEVGVWYGFIAGADVGDLYKYRIIRQDGHVVDKADPYTRYSEYATGDDPLRTASRVWDLSFEWSDREWMVDRRHQQSLEKPINIYEMHMGSWRKKDADGEWVWLNYREIADELIPYLLENGFTHVELMPPFEHGYYPSWGYQVSNYFAPTSRYGTPQDLKYLINELHNHRIAVLMDWVPAHFPKDAHGLSEFDGTELYSHQDPRQGEHPDWGTRIFNYGRHEVRSFLLSNVMYWIQEYHIDGIRVDAVSSMIYLDYGREDGQWIPNAYGGRENLEAIAFLRDMNRLVRTAYPGVITIAEESTAWPNVSRPVEDNGLGFTYKWSLGWMHDILEYLSKAPEHRKYHQDLLTMYPHYAFSENFILPLSHDEVVHLKNSLLGKMPGNDDQRFANLRLLFAYMATMPGKKLMFMGNELAEPGEWNPDVSLSWHLLDDPRHQGIQRAVAELNHLVSSEPALHELDVHPRGFEWIDFNDADQNVISYVRRGIDPNEAIMVVINFSDMPRENYRIGMPWQDNWQEIFNSNAAKYGGTDSDELGVAPTAERPMHDRPVSAVFDLPPLSVKIYKGKAPDAKDVFVMPKEGYRTNEELGVAVELARRNVSGGMVPEGYRKVSEGDEVTLQVISNRPDFDGSRRVYLESNRNVTGSWRRELQPATFVENRGGRAVYEFKVRAQRSFDYNFVFVNADGTEEWTDIPFGNHTVEVKKQYTADVVFVGMEHKLFAKVGGLADVMHSLPRAFAKSGNDTTVILPHFKNLDYQLEEYGFEDVPGFEIEIPFRQRDNVRLKAKQAIVEGVKVYILDAETDDLFGQIYKDNRNIFLESILLSRGSLELLRHLGRPVSVINSADHHAALVPLYMETLYKDDFSETGSVFTIHNFRSQGDYPLEWYEELGMPFDDELYYSFAKYGRINMLSVPGELLHRVGKGHYVNTVSQGYAQEIREVFSDVANLYSEAGIRFGGILNGLDFEAWDPNTDPNIARNYSLSDGAESIKAARERNKKELQWILSPEGDKSLIKLKDPANVHGELTTESDRLLVGVVSRLDSQKQIDIIADMLEDMYAGRRPALNIDVLINGTGDPALTQRLAEIASDARKHNIGISVVFVNEYLQVLTQKLMAGADVLLIPSYFEPSGLTQMQAMRYGAVPVVRRTGGLADTVFEDPEHWNGFVFEGADRLLHDEVEDMNRRKINTSGLYDAVSRAQDVYYNDPETWTTIVEQGMSEENDWNRSLNDYMNVYGWLYDERHQDVRGGTILSGDQVVKDKDTVVLRVAAHSRSKSRRVYLHSNRNVLGEWVTDKTPARYVETIDGQDIFEVEVQARRNFEYTFAFDYGNDDIVFLEHSEGYPKVTIESEFTGAVAFVGMEFGPLVKVGGQGDVMFELPKALVKSNKEVAVVLPKFDILEEKLAGKELVEIEDWKMTIPFEYRDDVTLRAYETDLDGVRVILIDADAPDLFIRPYNVAEDGSRDSEFYESILLSRGSLDVLRHLKRAGSLDVDVINSADHHTALIPLYMRHTYAEDFARTGNVFTIHNIGYQGRYEPEMYSELGLDESLRDMVQIGDELVFMGVPPTVINRLGKEGNYINTVSSSYAKETRPTQFGLNTSVLQSVGNRYGGILNGLDFDVWDPATDKMIHTNYSITDGMDAVLEARAQNKRELQEILSGEGDLSEIGIKDLKNFSGRLRVGSDRMLVGLVSRLVGQKQIDIIADMIDDMLNGRKEQISVDFVLNGTGDSDIEQRLAELAKKVEEAGLDMSFAFVNEYLQPVTQKIMAGADVVLVPSDYEPSGLTQMQAMRYGAVPVVRNTGGLADTVHELGDNWSGFVFDGVPRLLENPDVDQRRRQQNADDLFLAIRRANEVYVNDREQWHKIINTAMRAENDWSRSLGDYLNVYTWLTDELKRKADPGFAKMSRTLSASYQEYLRSDPEPGRPFVVAVKGNYASGKSMMRRALMDELEKFGLVVDFVHDEFYFDDPAGYHSIADAVRLKNGVNILIYEIERYLPTGADEIDMYIETRSELSTVKRRIAADSKKWEDLEERVLASMSAEGFSALTPDVSIQLDTQLTDDEFREFIGEGLVEMSFTKAPPARDSTANARLMSDTPAELTKERLRGIIEQRMPSRTSGVLTHVSSLDSEYGIGDFGPSARRFVDFLIASNQDVWQVLPLNPTDAEFNHSPYSSDSSFALNPLFVSPDDLVEMGVLSSEQITKFRRPNNRFVDYDAVSANKREMLRLAFDQREDGPGVVQKFKRFKALHRDWLDRYVMYRAISAAHEGRSWNEWPEGLRDRRAKALVDFRVDHKDEIEYYAFEQFLLFEQWGKLQKYAQKAGVKILGDLPLYVSYDSADVWSNKELFNLDDDYNPITISGVPPDAFSADGQKWGHPTFHWRRMQANGYRWWMERIAHNLQLYDQVRLDHFRGLVQYWSIPADAESANAGHWEQAGDQHFFSLIIQRFGVGRLIAEDLGEITPDVIEVLEQLGIRRMKILQFGFDGENLRDNTFFPENYDENSVAYTGTHDNNTIRGWFRHELGDQARENLQRFLGKDLMEEQIHWDIIQAAMRSGAETVIFPLQDVFGLDESSRMNLPGVAAGNWTWRISSADMDADTVRELGTLKATTRPPQIKLMRSVGMNLVSRASKFLRDNNYDALAQELEQFSRQNRIREWDFRRFAAATYKDDNNTEYILTSSVDSDGKRLSETQRIANLIFAIGATQNFNLDVDVNERRMQAYLDRAMSADTDVGGIDLNPDLIQLNVEGEMPSNNALKYPYELPVPVDIKGFVPVIIQISPVPNILNYMGVNLQPGEVPGYNDQQRLSAVR